MCPTLPEMKIMKYAIKLELLKRLIIYIFILKLLTVNPEENCLALVYRDEETLKFTKCVNSKINELNKNGCFYEISVVYYE